MLRRLILVPLLKTTRKFSYNDPQRQKLSKSPLSEKRVSSFIKGDWEAKFLQMFVKEIQNVLDKTKEYQSLLKDAGSVGAVVEGGVDTFRTSRKIGQSTGWDFLITSPPYCEVDRVDIYSQTYFAYRNEIKEQHLQQMYDRYFHGVLGSLESLSEQVSKYMFLFVGSASVRSTPIPIDTIFTEHFINKPDSKWRHESTLIDPIVNRVMFRSKKNPANGLGDKRINTEQLVVLKRK